MANAINSSYSMLYQNFNQVSKRSATSEKTATNDTKNSAAKFGDSANVSFSGEALAALANQKNSSEDIGANYFAEDSQESKLSSKAQDFLKNLREKYGDYDFVISDNFDGNQSLVSSKGYSVVFSTEEIERMANDEEYANEMMKKVDDAVKMTDKISESGQLGEGVQFSQVTVAFDDQGNTKLFAQLEKMSEEQRERFEQLKEKRAEEKKEAAAAKDDEEPEKEPIAVKQASVEASSEEELLEKILGIDWNNIAEENFYF